MAIRKMAYLKAEGFNDNSAIRGGERVAEATTLQGQVQNDIALMGAFHCSPYAGPLSPDAFNTSIVMCSIAMLGRQAEADKATEKALVTGGAADYSSAMKPLKECDWQMWQPRS